MAKHLETSSSNHVCDCGEGFGLGLWDCVEGVSFRAVEGSFVFEKDEVGLFPCLFVCGGCVVGVGVDLFGVVGGFDA